MLLLFLASIFAAPSTVDDLPPGWRLVSLPEGGELRYLPPGASAADYPRHALSRRIEGRTVLRLVVSPLGRILDCRAIQSAGDAELDRRACQLYRSRAQFKFNGVSRPQTFNAPIEWRIE
jgi:TonB family protein